MAAGGRAQQPGLAIQSSSKPKTQTIVRDAALESPHLLHAGEERLQDERLARHNVIQLMCSRIFLITSIHLRKGHGLRRLLLIAAKKRHWPDETDT